MLILSYGIKYTITEAFEYFIISVKAKNYLFYNKITEISRNKNNRIKWCYYSRYSSRISTISKIEIFS